MVLYITKYGSYAVVHREYRQPVGLEVVEVVPERGEQEWGPRHYTFSPGNMPEAVRSADELELENLI
jgi:hypothetical protein